MEQNDPFVFYETRSVAGAAHVDWPKGAFVIPELQAQDHNVYVFVSMYVYVHVRVYVFGVFAARVSCLWAGSILPWAALALGDECLLV